MRGLIRAACSVFRVLSERRCRHGTRNTEHAKSQSDGHILKPHLHLAVGAHLRPAPFRPPALHVHRDGVAGNVSPRGLDMNSQRGGVAAQALRADAGLIDRVEELFLKRSHL